VETRAKRERQKRAHPFDREEVNWSERALTGFPAFPEAGARRLLHPALRPNPPFPAGSYLERVTDPGPKTSNRIRPGIAAESRPGGGKKTFYICPLQKRDKCFEAGFLPRNMEGVSGRPQKDKAANERENRIMMYG